LETRKIKDLIPYDRNPRNNKDAVDKVLESLNRHGQVKPIVLSAKGKPFEQETIVAGHTTMQALKRFGAKEAFVVVKEFADEAQFVDYNIRDNKAGEFAQWDDQELANLSAEFEIDLDEMGFEDFDIEEESAGNTDEDAVPEVPEEPTAKLGQIYKLGDHRLMCGDSTDKATVEALMDGEKADMVFTDPPYGIAYSSSKFDGNTKGVTNKRNKADMIIGDGEDFDPSFILEMFPSVKEIFIWGMQYYPHKLGRGGIICWNKKQESEADCPHGDFELCWSKSERNKMCWLKWGGFNNKEKGEDRLHTTQKPIDLGLWFFDNWGKGKAVIVDLFGGSGSTLIACEKTKRKCRMMELDPKYIDVIIERWQNFTGKKAELIT
jgi:DNA modification methylase